MPRRDFGTVRKLPSGRFQARYVGPDGVRRTLDTFPTKKDAQTGLAGLAADIADQGPAWLPPGLDPEHDETTRVDKFIKSTGSTRGAPLFSSFARDVLALRADELAPRTLEGYESLLNRYLLPTFGFLPLNLITVQRVDAWWAAMAKETGKVNRRNAYFLLSGIMKRALRYKHVTANPCVIENAGASVAKPRPYLSLEEFGRIVDHAPPLLHAPLWTFLGAHVRLGELVGLNRGDVDVKTGRITIERQAQQARGGLVIRQTKTGNRRQIKMLEPARAALVDHLKGNTDPAEAPLFRGPKGGRLARGYIDAQWVKAREAAGLPDAHLHDIRHTGLTLVAAYATTREVMNRGGHTSVAAALKYQHATEDRDTAVADAASAALTRATAKKRTL
jgi:integrase